MNHHHNLQKCFSFCKTEPQNPINASFLPLSPSFTLHIGNLSSLCVFGHSGYNFINFIDLSKELGFGFIDFYLLLFWFFIFLISFLIFISFLQLALGLPFSNLIRWKLRSLMWDLDGLQDTLPQNTASWYIEYFKMKEFEKMAEAGRSLWPFLWSFFPDRS